MTGVQTCALPISHGVKGEMAVALDADPALEPGDAVIMEIDGRKACGPPPGIRERIVPGRPFGAHGGGDGV